MASVFSVMFAMCRVPLGLTVNRWSRERRAPLRNQVMVGVGDPEALQVRFSEALFPAASVTKTTASWGSSSKLGGVPVTAQEQTVTVSKTWLTYVVVHQIGATGMTAKYFW